MAGKIQASREHTDTGEHVRLLDDGYPCQTFRGAASHATTLNNSERDTDVGTARQEVYATSPVRWLVLIASATLNFSSAMVCDNGHVVGGHVMKRFIHIIVHDCIVVCVFYVVMCACARACVRACVRVCVRACMHACSCVCVCVFYLCV